MSLSQQILSIEKPNDPDKCYSKCLIPDHYEYELVWLPVGINQTDSLLIKEYFQVQTYKVSYWKKLGKQENCPSANPEDCFIWCLYERGKDENFYIETVRNDDHSEKFIEIPFLFEEIKEAGGFTELREVVCKDNLGTYVIEEISEGLENLGYELNYTDPDNFISDLKIQFEIFQRDFELPIGDFNLESVEFLRRLKDEQIDDVLSDRLYYSRQTHLSELINDQRLALPIKKALDKLGYTTSSDQESLQEIDFQSLEYFKEDFVGPEGELNEAFYTLKELGIVKVMDRIPKQHKKKSKKNR